MYAGHTRGVLVHMLDGGMKTTQQKFEFTRSRSRPSPRLPVRLLWSVADVVYPPSCAMCTTQIDEVPADGAVLCRDCRIAFVPADVAWCRRCGAPVEHPAADLEGCVQCRRRRFDFSAVYPLGLYEGQLRMAVLRMKRYRENPLRMAVARLLVDQLAPRMADEPLDVVLPVPMHWTRRLFRGTNSPEAFAARLARQLDLPVRSDLLRRRRSTRPQAALSLPQRRANVRGAFSLTRGTDVRDARILLVDDVLTTGATCQEVARTLRAAGAKRVIAAVVGRTSGTGVKAH